MTQPALTPNRLQTAKEPLSLPKASAVATPAMPVRAPLAPSKPAAPSATTSGITPAAELLARLTGSAQPANADGEISRLLTLFPKAKRVNIPMLVRITTDGHAAGDWEKDWLMFVGADFAIFPSNLPLRGNETLMFRRPGETAMTPAVVVAMQFDGPRVIVAVRFVSGLPDWLTSILAQA